MTNLTSRIPLILGIALMGTGTLLAGCGSDPVTRTTTTEETTTSARPVNPAMPMGSTTTTTTTTTKKIE